MIPARQQCCVKCGMSSKFFSLETNMALCSMCMNELLTKAEEGNNYIFFTREVYRGRR